jgi:hypothetical protein
MEKLEAIKYFSSKTEDSAVAVACIREIVEDLDEPIDITLIDEMVDICDEC